MTPTEAQQALIDTLADPDGQSTVIENLFMVEAAHPCEGAIVGADGTPSNVTILKFVGVRSTPEGVSEEELFVGLHPVFAAHLGAMLAYTWTATCFEAWNRLNGAEVPAEAPVPSRREASPYL